MQNNDYMDICTHFQGIIQAFSTCQPNSWSAFTYIVYYNVYKMAATIKTNS